MENKRRPNDVIFNMKFDKIIMNPPYSKNLHLKILAKSIEKLSENGTCVNLSPIRWLQDPLAKYKKNSDYKKFEGSVISHIEEIKEIDAHEAQEFFGNVMNINLGIYACSSKNTSFDKCSLMDKLTLKILSQIKSFPTFDANMKDGWRVRIPLIGGGESSGSGNRKAILKYFDLKIFYDGMKDGKPWYDFYQKNQYSKTTPEITRSIHFNSERESINFTQSLLTNVAKYYTHNIIKDVNIFEQDIMWMGDAINPRTGKKGYESVWTNEDFYKYFGITEDEQKLIEQTMEKYR